MLFPLDILGYLLVTVTCQLSKYSSNPQRQLLIGIKKKKKTIHIHWARHKKRTTGVRRATEKMEWKREIGVVERLE